MRARRTRLALFLFAGTYLLFVVYGSLVPLDFHPLSPQEAWARFRSIPYLQLDIGSRADWVANILLFIPLAFLCLGAIAPWRRSGAAALASVVVWFGCVALSVGIEYAQIYFPPRTVSLNDVLAESLGGALGVAAWWIAGRRALRTLERWRALRGEAGLAEWLLWPYALFLAVYDLMPFDLTLSPYDLATKWKDGRIVLIPFSFPVPDLLQRIYDPVVEALLWLPLAALWLLSGRGGPLVAWCVTVLAAAAVEFMQLIVYSRVSDVTDVLCAAAGAGAGVWIGGRLRARLHGTGVITGSGAEGHGLATPRARVILLALVAGIAWSVVMLVAFWYPFDFHTDSVMVRARLHMMRTVPFATYYFGTEYRAFTELLHKLSFFAPLGACLAIACGAIRGRLARALCTTASLGLVAAAALGIELGQVLLPDKFPSFTDSAIEWCGGALGFWAVGAIRARLGRRRPGEEGGAP